MFDIIIRNGRILDGTGNPWYYGEIGITGEYITHLGPAGSLENAEAKRIIDAKGKYVTPGFIDIHAHSDFTILQCPTSDSKIFQGVTTELTGHCGYSLAPVAEAYLDGLKQFTAFMPGSLNWNWRSTGEFLDEVEKTGISTNLLALVGHGTLQISVMGFEKRPATRKELDEMKALLAKCLDEGAAGLSLGLAYPPGSFTNKEELTELAEVVRSRKKILTSHVRDEGDFVLEAIREMLDIARETGVRLQICHLKAQGKHNWYKMDEVFRLLENARDEGIDVTFDVYPYTKLNTLTTALLPVWAQDGGIDSIVERLKDSATKRRIFEDMKSIALKYGGWENVVIASCNDPKNSWCEGLSIAEIGARLSVEPDEAFAQIMIDDRCGIMAVCNCLNEENLERALKHPLGMLCSDGKTLTTEGALSLGRPHPRNFAAFTRFLAHFVRDEGLMTLEDGIRRMTTLPAERLGIDDRGMLHTGYKADVLVFDLDRLKELATFQSPQHYSEGMDAVIVNGQLTVESGRHLRVRNGRVIRV